MTKFLDLPELVVCNVFDRLHVADRMRLNMALPRAHRIVKTLRTDAGNDTSLSVVEFALKRRSKARGLSIKLGSFVHRNRDDPTVCGMMMPAAVVPRAPCPTARDLLSGAYVAADLDVWTASSAPACNELRYGISRLEPRDYDVVMRDPFAAQILRTRVLCKGFLFQVVNSGNEALLQHMLTVGTSWVPLQEMDACGRDVWSLATIFAVVSPEKIDMLLRVASEALPPSRQELEAILQELVDHLHFDVARTVCIRLATKNDHHENEYDADEL